MDDVEVRRRWRLVLGQDADEQVDRRTLATLCERDLAIDDVLGFLFDREYESDEGIYRERRGGTGASRLSVPAWLGRVRELFPKSTADFLARTALERYQIAEILADKETLESVEPNIDLLRSLLAVQGLVPDHLLSAVKRIIARVVDDLRRRLEIDVRRAFHGTPQRRSQSPLRVHKNFDVARTLRRNLRHYQREQRRLVIERAYFHSRRHHQTPWDLILVVDQSGSMADSVIHAAVMAGIFHSLAMLRTHLLVFDTRVVDLSDIAGDPTEVLLRVQLGGGTDIAHAMAWADRLVVNPRRTMIVLVTDFFEGGDEGELVRLTARLNEGGTTLLGLAALDERAEPAYDLDLARKLATAGMHIGAMTPDRLAQWVAERARG